MSDELTAGPVPQLDGLTQVNAEESTNAAAPKAGEVEPQATANEGENLNDTPEQQKRLGGWQRKIIKAEQTAVKAEQERDFWREEALRTRSQSVPQKTVEQPQELKPPTRPKQEEYDGTPGKTWQDYEKANDKYIEDLADFKINQKLTEAEKSREQKATQQKEAERWQRQIATTTEKHADYPQIAEVAVQAMNKQAGPTMGAVAGTIADSEVGTQLLYHLGQKPEEVERLSKLTPFRAVIELGKLEEVIAKENAAGKEEKPQPQSQAATKYPPPQDKGRASGADPTALRDDLPMPEWEKRFAARLAAHKG